MENIKPDFPKELVIKQISDLYRQYYTINELEMVEVKLAAMLKEYNRIPADSSLGT